jgi:MoaA/NifB/PqqE/SkfB family radical SAM enzyme
MSVIPCITDQEFGERVSQELAGGRFPLSGQWEITCRCNLRCAMCYTDCFNTPDMLRQELSFPEIVRIMDEIQEAGCLELCLTGGEPLARKDFLDIYTYAKQTGFLVTVFTNGTLITEKIVDHWVRYPPAMIEISFHGLTEQSFERITQGPGSYERCLEGIGLILDRHLPLTLKTTGMTLNRDEILAIKAYVERLGGDRRDPVRYKFGSDIRPRLDGSKDVYEYQLPELDVIAIEQADPEFRTERLRQDREAETRLGQGGGLCAGGHRKFHIDAYGQLQLCSSNRRQSYDLRRGSFQEGFYKVLPQFPCPARQPEPVLEFVSIDKDETVPNPRLTLHD